MNLRDELKRSPTIGLTRAVPKWLGYCYMKFTNEDYWKQFWNEKIKIQNKVMMDIRKIAPSS